MAAYILADEGYDVWMLNCRGNEFSRNHTYLNPDVDRKVFWNFSWHEMGMRDLPETINYVLDKTGQRGVYYVAHSQGATVLYVTLSELPHYNQKIIAYVNLAPIVFMSHLRSVYIRAAASLVKTGASVSLPFIRIFIYIKRVYCTEIFVELGPLYSLNLFSTVSIL